MPTLKLKINDKTEYIVFEGTPILQKLLSERGFMPAADCGGRGVCGRCRVDISGDISEPSESEKAHGCRLACKVRLLGDCIAEISSVQRLEYIESNTCITAKKKEKWRFGAAVDIGTTTVALKLFNELGMPIAELSAMNPQASVASDVIGRISSAINGGSELLRDQITSCVSGLLNSACRIGRVMPDEVDRVVVSGNTAMLYLFSGISPKSIAVAPFKSETLFGNYLEKYYLSPCMNAFVGGDITCALLASGICKSKKTALLCDIGTNCELALWKNGVLYVTSVAAGPAFEGGEISCGCGNVPGAIESVIVENGVVSAQTAGNSAAVGICGTGLIDAVSAFLKIGRIDKSGYADESLGLEANGGAVTLTQDDIRALQLAKAAVRAGIEVLLKETKTDVSEIEDFCLAGGFGNRLNIDSAVNIGMLPEGLAKNTRFLGNAALTGACMLLFDSDNITLAEKIASNATHIELAGNEAFYTLFIKHIDF